MAGSSATVAKHPTHACPGYHAGIAAMLGTISALLTCKEDLKQGSAAMTFEVKGQVSAMNTTTFQLPFSEIFTAPANRTEALATAKGTILAFGDSWVTPVFLQYALSKLGYRVNGFDGTSLFYEDEYCNIGAWLKSMAVMAPQFASFVAGQINPGNLPKAILISGGGNDSVRKSQLERFVNKKRDGVDPINDMALNDHVADLILQHKTIVNNIRGAIKDEILNKSIPILIHGYDHPMPFKITRLEAAQKEMKDSWMYRPLFDLGYVNIEDRAEIMKKLIDALNKGLETYAKTSPLNVLYVNLRGQIPQKYDLDFIDAAGWSDNLHPTFKGYALLAEKIVKDLEDWHKANSGPASSP
jgi:lysophospholipase L1-like esterase